MNQPIINGRLKRWNADKGYGFIAVGGDIGDVFIHISALKHMSRPPVIGDVIYFRVNLKSDGKKEAVNANIAGVAALPSAKGSAKNASKRSSNSKPIVYLILLATIGFSAHKFYQPQLDTAPLQQKPESQPLSNSAPSQRRAKPEPEEGYIIIEPIIKPKNKRSTNRYKCEGKQHCSQMRSYQEALFYIKNCPNTKMDGDYDGIPCEKQFGR